MYSNNNSQSLSCTHVPIFIPPPSFGLKPSRKDEVLNSYSIKSSAIDEVINVEHQSSHRRRSRQKSTGSHSKKIENDRTSDVTIETLFRMLHVIQQQQQIAQVQMNHFAVALQHIITCLSNYESTSNSDSSSSVGTNDRSCEKMVAPDYRTVSSTSPASSQERKREQHTGKARTSAEQKRPYAQRSRKDKINAPRHVRNSDTEVAEYTTISNMDESDVLEPIKPPVTTGIQQSSEDSVQDLKCIWTSQLKEANHEPSDGMPRPVRSTLVDAGNEKEYMKILKTTNPFVVESKNSELDVTRDEKLKDSTGEKSVSYSCHNAHLSDVKIHVESHRSPEKSTTSNNISLEDSDQHSKDKFFESGRNQSIMTADSGKVRKPTSKEFNNSTNISPANWDSDAGYLSFESKQYMRNLGLL